MGTRDQLPSPNGETGDNQDEPPLPNGEIACAAKGSPLPNGNKRISGSSKSSTAGRDSRGRFTKGNPGGPGNPFARRIAAFRTALCTVVTEKDIQELAYQLLAHAKLGDLAAAKLLLAYAIGRPTDAVDPDTLDLKEWQLFRQSPVDADDLTKIFGGPPPQIMNALIRETWPAIGREFARRLADQLKDEPPPDETKKAG
jgi:hypothetical protein